MYDILLTCPAMINCLSDVKEELAEAKFNVTVPEIRQIMPETDLLEVLSNYDGWIIGDCPATEAVFSAGAKGRLRGAVKWGVGVDNVDFEGAKRAGIPVTNTPGAFNDEVADLAAAYVIALARQFHIIDKGVRKGDWPKPIGTSVLGKKAALVGYGNIGKALAHRLQAFGITVVAYDPYAEKDDSPTKPITHETWPNKIEDADFIVLTCALTDATREMVDARLLAKCKRGVRIVNVSRGQLIDETALASALASGDVHSAALEVLVEEPPSQSNPLLSFDQCLFGSHNGSNTREAVTKASRKAIHLLGEMLRFNQ